MRGSTGYNAPADPYILCPPSLLKKELLNSHVKSEILIFLLLNFLQLFKLVAEYGKCKSNSLFKFKIGLVLSMILSNSLLS